MFTGLGRRKPWRLVVETGLVESLKTETSPYNHYSSHDPMMKYGRYFSKIIDNRIAWKGLVSTPQLQRET